MAKTPKKITSETEVPLTLERAAILIDRIQKQASLTNIALYDLEVRIKKLEEWSSEIDPAA